MIEYLERVKMDGGQVPPAPHLLRRLRQVQPQSRLNSVQRANDVSRPGVGSELDASVRAFRVRHHRSPSGETGGERAIRHLYTRSGFGRACSCTILQVRLGR